MKRRIREAQLSFGHTNETNAKRLANFCTTTKYTNKQEFLTKFCLPNSFGFSYEAFKSFKNTGRLPFEVVCLILSKADPTSLVKTRLVSKQFYLASTDPNIVPIKIITSNLVMSDVSLGRRTPVRFGEISENSYRPSVELLDAYGETVGRAILDTKAFILIYKEIMDKDNSMWELLFDKKSYGTLWSCTIMIKYQLISELSSLCSIIPLLSDYLNNSYSIELPDANKEHLPTFEKVVKQPKRLKLDLHQYQIDALSWMMEVEKGGLQYYSPLYPWKNVNGKGVLIDLTRNQLVFYPSEELVQNVYERCIKGGILADEMGLGKTVEVIALILSNPRPSTDLDEIYSKVKQNVSPLYPRFRSNQDLSFAMYRARIHNSIQLAMDQSTTEDDKTVANSAPTPDTNITIPGTKPAEPEKKKTVDRYYINSKATLVICPSHLVKQWKDEIEKTTKPKLKVICITVLKDHQYINYEMMRNIDVVIVSNQFLQNQNYLNIGFEKSKGFKFSISAIGPYEDKHAEMMEEIKDRDLSEIYCPILDHFHYHRIIVDEAHEAFKKTPFISLLSLLKSNYRWYVTGTPFQNLKMINKLIDYLVPDIAIKHNFNYYQLADVILKQYYWRNTKISTSFSEKVAPPIQQVILLKFHPIEETLYKDVEFLEGRVYALAVCAQFSKAVQSIIRREFTNLSEIPQHWIEYRKSLKESLELELELKEIELKQYIKQRATKSPPSYLENAVTSLRAKVEHINKYLKIWKSLLPQENEKEKVLTKQQLSSKKFVSKFKKAVTSGDEKQTKKCLTPFVMIYGTKLANLLAYLHQLWKKDEDAKIILFSKYPALLEDIKQVLSHNGISSVTIKGTVHQRNNAIGAFKDDGPQQTRVILLSLKNAASGSNLVEGSHVILLDPMYGQSRRKIMDIENQAIGRAYRQGQDKQITIVRLVIENSVEKQLLEMVEEEKEDDYSSIEPVRKRRKAPNGCDEDAYMSVMFGTKRGYMRERFELVSRLGLNKYPLAALPGAPNINLLLPPDWEDTENQNQTVAKRFTPLKRTFSRSTSNESLSRSSSSSEERTNLKSVPCKKEEKTTIKKTKEEKSPLKKTKEEKPPLKKRKEEKVIPLKRKEEKVTPPKRKEEKVAPPKRKEEKVTPPKRKEEKVAPLKRKETPKKKTVLVIDSDDSSNYTKIQVSNSSSDSD